MLSGVGLQFLRCAISLSYLRANLTINLLVTITFLGKFLCLPSWPSIWTYVCTVCLVIVSLVSLPIEPCSLALPEVSHAIPRRSY